MAKHLIRKLHNKADNDVQFWPVVVSLCIFGGFLLGLVLIYLNNHVLFWPAVIGLPILIGALIIGLRLISNRYLRRSMQMALVLSLIVNLIILMIANEKQIFARLGELMPAVADVKREKTARPVPEFHRQSRIQQEINQRVESDTPEPDPDEIEKQETKPQEPPSPQPLPVPNPRETPKPNVVEKQQPNETPPRQSSSTSRLSRQTQTTEIRSGVTANTAQLKQQATQQSSTQQRRPTKLEKQTAENDTRKRDVQQQPTTVTQHNTPRVNRRQQETNPQTDATSLAQLPRNIAETPRVAPVAVVPQPQNPNVPEQTQPEAQPNNPQVAKQTTSKSSEPTTRQPSPNSQATVDDTIQRRQLDAAKLPQTASTAQPVTNRSNITPSVNLPANATAAHSQTVTPSVRLPAEPTAQATTANKQSGVTPVVERTTPHAAVSSISPLASSATSRRQNDTQQTSQSPANPRSLARNAPANAVTTDAVAGVASVNQASNAAGNSPTQLTAAETATERQLTSRGSSQRPAVEAPTTATSSDAPTPTPTRTASRQPRGPTATTVASAPQTVDRARATPDSLTSPTTSAATLPTPQGPRIADNPAISASTASVQRSSSNTASPATNVRSAEVATQAVASQVPQPSPVRSRTDSQPSLNPKSLERPVAARANLTAQAAATPVPIESPAAVQTSNSSGQSTNQPAPLVLTKAMSTGTAGEGRSQNLDRFTPTSTGTATAALDSAARPRATQTETGPAFSPSQSAPIRRSLADQAAPSASQHVSANTIAQVPGSPEPTTTNSTTSAVSVDSKSNADLGEVTASRGNVQVDVGETRTVQDATPGQRAAGGGQPELNFQSNSNRLARQQAGGAPSTSIAAAILDDQPVAPPGGGGTPSTSEVNPDATAVVRSDSGGPAALSSGPTATAISGPTENTNTATDVAPVPSSRAEAAEAVPEELAAGGGQEEEDEQERRRRLARAALAAGGPTISLPGSLNVELPGSPSDPGGQPGSSGPAGPIGPQATSVARADAGGQPSAAQATQLSGPTAGGGELTGKPQVARAEATDGEPGSVQAGGGTNSPARAETGPALATELQAAVVSTAGGPSSGVPQSQPLDAQGIEATKLAGGAAGITMSGPLGAVASQSAVAAVGAAVPGALAGQRQSSPADSGPLLASGPNAGSPSRRSDTSGLPPGTLAMAEVPIPDPAGEADSRSASDAFSGAQDVGPVKRDAAGSVLLNIDAKEGPGGLGTRFAPDAGISSRQARQDSPVLRIYSDARIVRSDVGGPPGTSAAAVVSTEGFRNRVPGSGRGRSGHVDPKTEASIESGLVFLQRHQSPDGSWSLARFTQNRPDREYHSELSATLDSDTAATGLALMAFQGAGFHHKEPKYAQTVSQGINWLLEHQKDDGDLFVPMDDNSNAAIWLYSHGIAAIALSEAYGMTQDPELREPAQKALDFLVKSQHPDRGGWRYSPGVGTDTSVTGWVFMAMYSGKIAGLNVPEAAFERVENWLNLCQKSKAERHLYRYNPYAANTPQQGHGRTPNNTMTAVGLTLRVYTGWETDDPFLLKGADHLLETLPEMGREQRVRYAHLSARDAYYWYYATQLMAHMGGEHWKTWNSRLHPLLLETQTRNGPMAGSWDPIRPTVDRWGPLAGRMYVTTLNLLSLEAPYRKLPIYKALVAEDIK